MGDCNTKLMAALLAGTSVDEVFRQEIEAAVNSVLESELEAFLGYEKHSVEVDQLLRKRQTFQNVKQTNSCSFF